tara:strand:- start:1119 stop:1343 length:225 start_codon:yes stop_codon:yes gene_type:complete
MARNYRSEYDNYHSKPTQKKRRAGRNTARNIKKKTITASSLKNKDVHHKDGNPRNNNSRNLSIVSKSKNRSRRI